MFRDIHKFVDSFEEPFLQKVCNGNVAEYFTPPIVDAYLFRETGEFRPLEFQGCFSELTVRTVPTDVLVVEAMGDKRVRITLSEDAICIDGGQFAIPPVSRDFSFKGCRYRLDVSSSDGSVTLHMDR